MAEYDKILTDYQRLRAEAIDPKSALRRLSSQIKPLSQKQKEELAALIRKLEGDNFQPSNPANNTRTVPTVKKLTGEDTSPKPLKSLVKSTKGLQRTYCWQCGKPNRAQEAICIHCGAVLKTPENAATRQLAHDGRKPEYFDKDSVLLFRVRDFDDEIHLRPQDSDHELIVGRADTNRVIIPDVDLEKYKAGEMGVSRMHMSLAYDPDNKFLQVTDLSSSNGVFINGQRLVAQEKRVLRDGDQLRLGELVINVFYQFVMQEES